MGLAINLIYNISERSDETMNKLREQFLFKINKSVSTSISMRFRLFLFLLILVLTMSAGIIVILLVTGTFSAGITESKQLVRNELQNSYQDISKQYGQLSVQVVEFSKELSQRIEEKLRKQNLSFSSLSDHPDQIEELISDLFEKTYYSLQKSNCSGAFFVLDTTVNTDLKNSKYSKAGLYIKNMEPNIVSSSSPTFTILRGFPSIGRENSIDLHTQWSMEFDIKDARFYNTPIRSAKNNKDLPLSKLYYWSDPFTLSGTSEEAMVCTIPIMDSKSNLYGVCGFEISAMLFKLSHMPANNNYTRMFCMLSPLKDNEIPIDRSMFAGGYSIKNISENYTNMTVKESRHSFTTYYSNNENLYLGFHIPTLLYPKGSPFFDEDWITAVLIPKEDIVDSITRLNIILSCLLSLLVTSGVIISIIFSNKYLKPISQGIEIIKSAGSEEAPKTNVQEIDDLIHYLALYKKELNRKVTQDKYQISMLEQFVGKTKTLSPAERSVFNLYAKGLSAKEIADQMFLSINTIKTHNKRIFAKLGVTSREELLLYINMLKEIGLELK
jgi:DNA-binding CsgD family transcriptional regulator